jgi:uncharacterized membrane protein
MSRNKIILLIGILLIAMPFLGFPSTWKTIFYIVFGAILIIMAVIGHIRRRSPRIEQQQEVVTEVYVQDQRDQV